MENILISQVTKYVEENSSSFHQSRIDKLATLSLKSVLKKKNPYYLYKAKYLLSTSDIVKSLSDDFISSAEETIFDDWLERLAIFVCSKVYGGKKSTTAGIDLEFEKESIRYIVSIKSDPNWGDSSQEEKMKKDFLTAKRTLRTSNNSSINIQAVNGCCYGKENVPDQGDYFKYCGQDFWYFISGEKTLYTDIIEPLGRERNDEFMFAYSSMINRFTKEFIDEFCLEDGSIDWNKLVQFNSGSNALQ